VRGASVCDNVAGCVKKVGKQCCQRSDGKTPQNIQKKGNKGATRILKGQNGNIRDTFYSYVTFFAQFK